MRRTVLAAGLTAALSLLIAPAARAQSAELEPSGPHPPPSARTGLILGGLAVTGVAYGASVGASALWEQAPGATALRIPVAGPWIALFTNRCPDDDPDCGFLLYLRAGLFIIDGILQVGGVGIAAEGVFLTTRAADAPAPTRRAAVVLKPAPVVTRTSTGLGVIGTF